MFVSALPVLLSTTLTVNTLVPKRLGLTVSVAVNLLSVVRTDAVNGWGLLPVCCCCCAALAGNRVPPYTFSRPTQTMTPTPSHGSQRHTLERRLVFFVQRPLRRLT